jgi:hypothetical protein
LNKTQGGCYRFPITVGKKNAVSVKYGNLYPLNINKMAKSVGYLGGKE